VVLSHGAPDPVTFRVEADVTGTGEWMPAATVVVIPGTKAEYRFPEALGAYWFRVIADRDTTATAEFVYE
jgi:hypothetical protein